MAALAILVVILLAVAGYIMFGSSRGDKKPQPPPAASAPESHPPLPQAVVEPPAPHKPAFDGISAPPRKSDRQAKVLHTPQPAENQQPLPQVATLPPGGKGQLAIIIDDMGTTLQEARSLAAIGVPLTFSVIPGLRSYREVASFAAANGIETMIHIPMQSKGWPQRRLEPNGLLVDMDAAEISERVNGFIRDIPRAVGANNHMGSEFTEHEEKLRPVLEALKERGLFFVDSVTTPASAGQRLARELGVKSSRRQVFLDNEQNSNYIRGQLNQAVRVARKNGAAIAICHPHPATIQVLAALLPGLEQQGVRLVPASKLVR